MLQTAREKGYRISSFPDFDASAEKTIILRHDVDYTLNGVLELASIENDINVTASYLFRVHAHEYNVFTPHVFALIQRLQELGHDIGLHFEAGSIGRALDLTPSDLLRKEKAILEMVIDREIVTASEHRDVSHDVHQTRPMHETHDLYDFGFRYYAMDPAFTKDMKYLSDSNAYWREGDPLEHLERHNRLQVLIHPDWWYEKDLLLKGAYAHGLLNGPE